MNFVNFSSEKGPAAGKLRCLVELPYAPLVEVPGKGNVASVTHPHDFCAGIDPHPAGPPPGLARLAAALEASWDHRTSHGGVTRPGNPALGQCYPTSRIVQYFFSETEIACGEVWTGAGTECHFWNVRGSGHAAEWIDLSWQQFPPGSVVRHFKLLDRRHLADSPPTVERCALLLRRVLTHLTDQAPDQDATATIQNAAALRPVPPLQASP